MTSSYAQVSRTLNIEANRVLQRLIVVKLRIDERRLESLIQVLKRDPTAWVASIDISFTPEYVHCGCQVGNPGHSFVLNIPRRARGVVLGSFGGSTMA